MAEKLPTSPPDHWYKYDFPLKKVVGAPVPSEADYSPENVAWLIEMFANILGTGHNELTLQYENNTPNNKNDDIFVSHPNDKLYLPEESKCKPKSLEQHRYEQAAKRSSILRTFEEHSPANIKYFKPTC